MSAQELAALCVAIEKYKNEHRDTYFAEELYGQVFDSGVEAAGNAAKFYLLCDKEKGKRDA